MAALGSSSSRRAKIRTRRPSRRPRAPWPSSTRSNGDQDKAKEWMKTAINAKPRDLKIRLLAAQWAFETGQLTEAERQASAALQLDPQSLDALLLRGLVALFQKNYKAAEEYFETAHLLKPNTLPRQQQPRPGLDRAKQRGEETTRLGLCRKQRPRSIGKRIRRVKPLRPTVGCSTSWTGSMTRRRPCAPRPPAEPSAPIRPTTSPASWLKRGHDKEAIQLLENALKTTGPFQNRDDAKTLLEELKK